jgi:hypothetical protein
MFPPPTRLAEVSLAHDARGACAESPFKVVTNGMVGSWVGRADGHDKAVCAQPSCTSPVSYYGVDDDLPAKRHAIRGIARKGAGQGDIVIAFGATTDARRMASSTRSSCPRTNSISRSVLGRRDQHDRPLIFDLTRQM